MQHCEAARARPASAASAVAHGAEWLARCAGILKISGRKVELAKPATELCTDPQSSARTLHSEVVVDRGADWAAAMERYAASHARSQKAAFYRSKRPMFGQHLVVLAESTANESYVLLFRPNTGLAGSPVTRSELTDKYDEIEKQNAEREWNAIFSHTESACMHMSGCQAGSMCRYGQRRLTTHLLSGSLLPLLARLDAYLLSTGNFEKKDRSARVVTGRTETGEELIGLRVDEQFMDDIRLLLQKGPANKSTNAIASERPTPVVKQSSASARRKPATLFSFFSSAAKGTPAGKADEPAAETDVVSSAKKQKLEGSVNR